MLPSLSPKLGPVAQREKCVLVRDADEYDVAAWPAVAPVRAAPRHMGFPTETRAPATSIAALHEHRDPVDEHLRAAREDCLSCAQLAAGRTLTRCPRVP